VVLLADPDDESLISGDLAAAAMRPIACDACREEERVFAHVLEHQVSLDELGLLLI